MRRNSRGEWLLGEEADATAATALGSAAGTAAGRAPSAGELTFTVSCAGGHALGDCALNPAASALASGVHAPLTAAAAAAVSGAALAS